MGSFRAFFFFHAKYPSPPAISARTATPPTVPPAIAPTLGPGLGLDVAEGVDDDDVADVVVALVEVVELEVAVVGLVDATWYMLSTAQSYF